MWVEVWFNEGYKETLTTRSAALLRWASSTCREPTMVRRHEGVPDDQLEAVKSCSLQSPGTSGFQWEELMEVEKCPIFFFHMLILMWIAVALSCSEWIYVVIQEWSLRENSAAISDSATTPQASPCVTFFSGTCRQPFQNERKQNICKKG